MEEITEVPITGHDKTIKVELINGCPIYGIQEGYTFDAHIARFRDKTGYQIYSGNRYKTYHKSFVDLDELLGIVNFI